MSDLSSRSLVDLLSQRAELRRLIAETPEEDVLDLMSLGDRLERTASLSAALRALIARVERAGGYASPEDQAVLRQAKQALANS